MSWTIPNLVISFVHLRHRRRILPAASASERFVGIDQRMKAGPDGNHGFLLRRAVRIRQSAWGVAPRHSTHRAVSLTILAVIKLTPSRCGSRRSIAAGAFPPRPLLCRLISSGRRPIILAWMHAALLCRSIFAQL